jgi:hypothetical protein
MQRQKPKEEFEQYYNDLLKYVRMAAEELKKNLRGNFNHIENFKTRIT